MSSLTIQEKLDLVKKLCEKHEITSYEIGDNTELNASGVHKILTGKVLKPRNKTLNIILNYIENRIVDSNIDKKDQNKISEAGVNYPEKRFEDVLAAKTADRVIKEIDNKIKPFEKYHQHSRDSMDRQALATDELMDEISEIRNELKSIAELIQKTFAAVSRE